MSTKAISQQICENNAQLLKTDIKSKKSDLV